MGYLYNNIYTSLTGGFDEGKNNTGHLTLILLYFLLKKLGVKIWDLGMFMEYKTNFMAESKNREEYI